MTEVLTPAQLQELLQIGRKQTYELINDGKIHSIRIGRSIRIPRQSVNEYLGIKNNEKPETKIYEDQQLLNLV